MDPDTLMVVVGGKKFYISKQAAMSIPRSVLSGIATDECKERKFDRDPMMFRHILNVHRTGAVHTPRDVCPCSFRQEMLFWKIPLKMVAPCCWKTIHEIDNDIVTLKLLAGEEDKLCVNKTKVDKVDTKADLFKRFMDMNKSEEVKCLNHDSLKTRLWLLVDEPGSSPAAKIWFFVYICMVMVSVVVHVIWAEPSVRVDPYFYDIQHKLASNSSIAKFYVTIPEKVKILIGTDPHPALFTVDIICIIFFIFEAVVHFLACPSKKTYFCNLYNLIKLTLCVTMVTSTLIETNKGWLVDEENDNPNIRLGKFYFACKSMNVLRLLLIFHLRKIYKGLHIFLLALKQSVKELFLLAFTFGLAVIVYGCLIFSAEIESLMFPSTQISMWWALITMTTIGYGDFYPTTTFGYLIGSFCAINGLIVIALPVASIANTFSDLYSRNSDLQKHKMAIREEEAKSDDAFEQKH